MFADYDKPCRKDESIYERQSAMKRLTIVTLLLTLLTCPALHAQRRGKASGDVQAIRKAVRSYVAAFNRGDADAVASHWGEQGEWVSPSGQRFTGRRAIRAQ